ncbi:MAG: hypothetical protein RLZZ385_370, partial [Pseudomonadota bacterium]
LEVSGNKVRKLEFCIAQALDDGCDTLITCGGLQSNHCRATAILGARLGLKVHLILRGEPPAEADGNLLLDHLAGATISYVPQRDWAGHAELAARLQQSYAASGRRAAFFPTGASDEVGLWGYVAACAELRQDFTRLDWTPDVIVVATGSGGTQSGLIAGTALLEMTPRIVSVAVSDDGAYFAQKVRQDLHLWQQRYAIPLDVDKLPVVTLDDYIGPGYGKAGPEVFATIAELARLEGLFLDPVYTGKAFHGMVTELEKAARGQPSALTGARNVLFIHTGGLFGLFPQRRQFEFS